MNAMCDSINQFLDQLHFPYQTPNQTEHIEYPSAAGVGFVRRMIPRPDMLVTITKCMFDEQRTVKFEIEQDMAELLVCFQGTGEVHTAGGNHSLRPDTVTLRLMNGTKGEYHFPQGHPMTTVGIHIPVPTFNRFLTGLDGSPSIEFHQLTGKRSLLQFEQAIDRTVSQLAVHLMHTPCSPHVRNIALECKVLELLSISFQQLLDDNHSRLPAVITRSELARLQQAKDVLIQRMENPPSLLELSRIIGMNDFKLKNSFKEVFGTTVFGYLREKRLEKAMLLLLEGGLSVAQVAVSVGYSNISYFAEAFRKQYGFNPSEVIRRPAFC